MASIVPVQAVATTYSGAVRVSGSPLADADVGANETISPDGKWLVFESTRHTPGRHDLWSVPLDGTAATPTRLTSFSDPTGSVIHWEVSPDSARVVYTGDLDVAGTTSLYSARLGVAGSQVRLSTRAGGFDSDVAGFRIAPNSSRVVYRGDLHADGRTEIYSAPIGMAGQQVRLNHLPVAGGSAGFLVHITADSSRVVFDGQLDEVGVRELYSAPIAQSGQQIQLSTNPVTGGDLLPAGGEFTLSPDGSRVVYHGDLDVDERIELYSAPTNQAGQQRKLHTNLVAGGRAWDYEITPNSARVVFRADLDVAGQTELYSAPIAQSGQQVQLNDDPAGDITDFDVAPDGSRVAFSGFVASGTHAGVYGAPIAQSGQQVTLSAHSATGGVDRLWGITPDSSRVVFSSDHAAPGVQDLYSAPLATAGGRIRIGGPASGVDADIDDLQFSPDGQRVVHCGDLVVDERYDLFSAPVGAAGKQVMLSSNASGGDVDCSDFDVTADSSRVVYLGEIAVVDQTEAFSAPLVSAGKQVRLNNAMADPASDIYSYRIAPDASFVVYRGDQDVYNRSELWATSRGQQPPAAPSSVTVGTVTRTSAAVAWTRPPISEVTGYTVTATPSSGSATSVATTATSTTVSGLVPGTAYTLTVRASNPGGLSAASTAVGFTTRAPAATTPPPDPATTPDGLHRLWGGDRYSTAAAVALDRFLPDAVETVYLATGADFPDALAGGPLASTGEAPILLTRPDLLPDATADALAALGPTRVVALGGTVAVSEAVLDAAAAAAGGAGADRVFGPDRYATAASIAAELPTTDTVYLAVGTNFPDALAGGPATAGAPILLTTPTSLPDATAAALADIGPTSVVALGGLAVVPAHVLEAAATAAGGATTARLSGDDRYATALRIADTLGSVDTIYVSTGGNFPDAVTAGPAATAEGAPIVLTPTESLTDAVAAWIDAVPGLRRIVVLGGESAVSAEVEAQLEQLLD